MDLDVKSGLEPGVHPSRFSPAPLLGSRHLQTIWAPLFRRPPRVPLRRERWELPDGDFLDVDRLDGEPGMPRLLVLHGLEGSSESGYARGLLAQARRRGWHAAALNFRSCSGEANRLLRSYHSGETGDLAFAVEQIRAAAPGQTQIIIGISLGGNVLTRWLGAQAGEVPPEVRAAVAISAPFDLARCAASLDARGFWARVYRDRFLRTLKAKARGKATRFPDAFELAALERLSTLTGFDDLVTGPLHGFTGAADYYARCSSGPHVAKVAVPMLLLSAEDDPFIPGAALPREAAAASRCVRLEISPRGGHVGFVAGSLAHPRYWAEERAMAWLDATLEKYK